VVVAIVALGTVFTAAGCASIRSVVPSAMLANEGTSTTWDTTATPAASGCTPIQVRASQAREQQVITEIEDALPCNFSGTLLTGGYDVIYLAPLNGHTQAIFDAAVARHPDPAPYAITFTAVAGRQSYAEANAEVSQLRGADKTGCLVYSINIDGSVTISRSDGPRCSPLPRPAITTVHTTLGGCRNVMAQGFGARWHGNTPWPYTGEGTYSGTLRWVDSDHAVFTVDRGPGVSHGGGVVHLRWGGGPAVCALQ
jgi:hypothetical protein